MARSVKLGLLAVAALGLAALFLFGGAGGNWDYILPRRGVKVTAIALTGCAIAYATALFQTIANNRILTPNMIGFDAMYLLIQTAVVFVYGSAALTRLGENANFALSVGAMVGFAWLLYKFLFRKEERHVYYVLLAGVIMGTLFGSMTTFMQVMIDPNEFFIVQDRMFASFNNVNAEVLALAAAAIVAATLYSLRFARDLDAIALGRDQAIGLGVPYERVVKQSLVVVAVLVSASTALVGPIAFLGLLVVNTAVQLMGTFRHRWIVPSSALVAVVALLGGQLLVERVFTFSTTLSVIVNFAGGIYFLYLLLKENAK